MNNIVIEAIQKVAPQADVQSVSPVFGGDVNDAFCVVTTQKSYFVKVNEAAAADFFTYEADGLDLLRQTNTLAVPQVYNVGAVSGVAVLVLEWLSGEATAQTEVDLGRGLAHMHHMYGSAFGLGYDNYIGSMPQPNGWYDDWLTFFGNNVSVGRLSGPKSKACGRTNGNDSLTHCVSVCLNGCRIMSNHLRYMVTYGVVIGLLGRMVCLIYWIRLFFMGIMNLN